jgi:hypothetical protein
MRRWAYAKTAVTTRRAPWPRARSCSGAASTPTCPEHCLFFEARSITDAGWQRFERDDDTDDD